MLHPRVPSLAIAACFIFFGPPRAQSTAATFRAGASAIDITPEKFPVIVNAMFEERYADKAVDRLFARCLVLDDGTKPIAITVVDTCMLPRDLIDRAKKLASRETGIAVERMLVSATHTHSAPSAMGCLGSRADSNYAAWLPGRIAEGMEKAFRNLAPSRIGWAQVDDWEHTFSRRWIRRPDRLLTDPFGVQNVRANMHPGYQSTDVTGPAGPVDPGLSVLAVQGVDGRPVALLANYSQHYCGSPLVSSDYFGRFAQKIARRLNADERFVGIMSQGTSGDLMWMDYSAPAADIGYDAYADTIADRASEAYQRVAWSDWVPVEMAERTMTVGFRTPSAERLAWAHDISTKLAGRLPRTLPEIYALEAIHLHERPTAELKLQALRVGELGIAAIPNEVFALSGLKIKRQSPLRPTFTIELANGSEGYIPPPEQHKLGGYTTWPARTAGLVPEAEPLIVETALSLLEKVSGRVRKPLTDSHGPYAKAVLEGTPTAYWRLNDATIPTARDASGHHHDGTFEDGIALWLPGADSRIGFQPSQPQVPNAFSGEQINRAPHFAGGRLKTNLPNLGGTYSTEAWVWNGLPNDARPVTGYIFSRGPDGDANCPGDHLGLGGTFNDDSSGHLFFFNGNLRNQVLTGRTALSRREWHYIAFVREGRKVTIWLDGNAQPEISGECDVTLPPETAPLFIGGRSDNFANFEGKLDEVAVYDRALTRDEIVAHYRVSGMPPKPSAAPPTTDAMPISPQESLKKLHVRDGFRVELVVAEPLVVDPVAIDWDTAGRLWVVEMSDYPLGLDNKGAPGGRVRVLEDTDNDGSYDKATVFAEGLQMPTGLLTWRDGVLVTTAPEIVFLKDSDGDGRADIREVLYSGFQVGNPQLRVNGLRWGLDNWIYCAAGGHHGNYGLNTRIRCARLSSEVFVGSRDVRLRPDTGELEAESGPTQFGRNRDDWGRWFGTQNSWPLWHYVLPDHYLRRNPHVAAPEAVVQIITPKNPKVFPASRPEKRYHTFEEGGHFTSACSGMIYGDELLFPRGGPLHAFTCEPFHNLVHHELVLDDGVTFRGERPAEEQTSEFLASEDRWFRPVMTRTGPDGALWVVDMYRYMIEHPEWLPPEGRAELLPHYREGDDKGRIYRITPGSAPLRKALRLDRLGLPDLVAALDSPNAWQRDKAQQLLIWRADVLAVEPLDKLARESRNPLARLHALCTLDGLGRLESGLVESALADRDAGIRENALRLADTRETPGIIAAATKLVSDPVAKVRMQLAFSLGEWKDPRAGDALAVLALANPTDRHFAAAITSSALTHYRSLVAAIPKTTGEAFANLSDALMNVALGVNDRDAVASLLKPILADNEATFSSQQMDRFAQFLDALARRKSSLADLAQSGDTLSRRLQLASRIFEAAKRVATDGKKAAADRVMAGSLLAREPNYRHEGFPALAALLSPQAAPEIQRAASRALAATGDPGVPALLMSAWPSLAPEMRVTVLDEMLSRDDWALELLTRISKSEVAASALDAGHRTRLLKHPSGEIRTTAGRILAGGPSGDRAQVIGQFRPALLLKSDAVHGLAIFQERCATCHQRGDRGNDIGPDLRSVIAHEPARLLAEILDPNADVQPGYHAYNCRLQSGEELYGIIASETATSLTIKFPDGTSRTVLRSDIAALENSNRSLMPEGLEAGLTPQDVSDLIALLRSPFASPAEPRR